MDGGMQSRDRFRGQARLLRDHGVNRVSMGVQSLDEQLLDRLGRIHSREQVFKSFDILRAAGFDNLNLDLDVRHPSQTMAIWRPRWTRSSRWERTSFLLRSHL